MTIDLIEKVKNEVFRKSQEDFDETLLRFPYNVDTSHLIDFSLISRSFDNAIIAHSLIIDGILENFDSEHYVRFPVVLGRSNPYANSILFDNVDDAISFKLSLP